MSWLTLLNEGLAVHLDLFSGLSAHSEDIKSIQFSLSKTSWKEFRKATLEDAERTLEEPEIFSLQRGVTLHVLLEYNELWDVPEFITELELANNVLLIHVETAESLALLKSRLESDIRLDSQVYITHGK